MSSIMKGIVDESEQVSVIYINGKAATKYAKPGDAKADAERLRAKFPNKKIEVKQEVRGGKGGNEKLGETEAKKGADGKRCWKGKRYAGTENGKDKCIPVNEFAGDEKSEQPRREHPITIYIYSILHNKTITIVGEKLKRIPYGSYDQVHVEFTVPTSGKTRTMWMPVTDKKYPTGALSDNVHLSNSQKSNNTVTDGIFNYWAYEPQVDEAANPAQQAAIAIAKKKKAKTNEGVIIGHDAQDPEVAILGGAGSMSLSRLKRKAHGEAMQLMDDIAMGKFKASAYNIKQLANTLNTIVAAEEEMSKKYFGEDYTGQFAAEKTPAINPYGGLEDTQHRGAISEDRELYNAGAELEQIAAEMKELADNAMNLVRSTPEEGRARSYWYPHIIMAISQDHSYMGKNMFTMMDSAQNLMDGDEEEVDEAREPSDALRAAQKNLVDLSTGEVRRREDAKKAAAKRQREYDREFNRKPKKPTLDQIWQKIEHAISNYFPDGDPTDYLAPYMERNGLTWDDITRASKKNGYKDLWDYWNSLAQDIENDAYYDWHAAKRPEAPVNPLSKDAADIQHRNWVAKKNPKIRTRGFFLEEPTDPVGTQPGGWRRTDMEEDTSFGTGMGQGGNAGESYRKFRPKSAGTYKESSIMKGIKRESK